MEKFRYPLDFLGINLDYGATSNPYSASNPHKGIDFGWVDYQGEPVYSIGSGTVVESTFNNECGNYCAIKHDNGYVSYYFHLKTLPIVKVGQIIYREQLIGYMGNTGYSNGTHLHLGIKLNGAWIDPKLVCYLYANQNANTPTKKIIKVYVEEPKIVKVGTPISKNEDVDQLEIINDTLNVRDNPSGNILGYANLGIYNVLDIKEDNMAMWIKIEDGKWVARNDNWNIYYKKVIKVEIKEPIKQEEPQEEIEETPQERPKEEPKIEEKKTNIIDKLIELIRLFIDFITKKGQK